MRASPPAGGHAGAHSTPPALASSAASGRARLHLQVRDVLAQRHAGRGCAKHVTHTGKLGGEQEQGRASSCRSAMSSPSGTPVARSMISTRIGASHLALSRSLTRYLGAKLTLQRRCGLCSHSTHCGSRQPRLLPARVECFTLGAPPDIPGRGRVRGLQARRAARHTGARAGQASFTLGAPSDIPGRTRGPGVIDARRAARHTGARPGRAAFTLGRAAGHSKRSHAGPRPRLKYLCVYTHVEALRERTFCASGRPPLQRVCVSQVN